MACPAGPRRRRSLQSGPAHDPDPASCAQGAVRGRTRRPPRSSGTSSRRTAATSLFLDAAWKLLSAPGVEIDAGPARPSGPRDADAINERYDAYVVTLANAFRHSFDDNLDRLTRLIRRLRIPVVVLGVGAPGNGRLRLRGRSGRSTRTSRRCAARCWTDRRRSASAARPRWRTSARLGFRDVEVIGCPSMFVWGDGLRVDRRIAALDGVDGWRSRSRPTGRPWAGSRWRPGPLSAPRLRRAGPRHAVPAGRRHCRCPVAGRRRRCRSTRLTRCSARAGRGCTSTRGPGSTICAASTTCSARGSTAPSPRSWRGRRRRCSPTTRARWSSPATSRSRIGSCATCPADVDAADLHRRLDLAPFHAGHPARFATYIGFLERAGLDHIFAHEGAPAAFELRVAATPFPGGGHLGDAAVSGARSGDGRPARTIPGPAPGRERRRRSLRSRLRVVRVR